MDNQKNNLPLEERQYYVRDKMKKLAYRYFDGKFNKIAEHLKVDAASVSKWIVKASVPIHHKIKLKKDFNINPDWWSDYSDTVNMLVDDHSSGSTGKSEGIELEKQWRILVNKISKEKESLDLRLIKTESTVKELEGYKEQYSKLLFSLKFIMSVTKDNYAVGDSSPSDKIIQEINKLLEQHKV